MPIPEHKMAEYKASAKKRWREEEEELSIRYDQAWEIAKKAANILRERFGTQRIAVIGSLVHKRRFHPRSDVDLVVWELPEAQYFRAVARLLQLAPTHKVDLIRFEDLSDSFKKYIEQERVEL